MGPDVRREADGRLRLGQARGQRRAALYVGLARSVMRVRVCLERSERWVEEY